MGNINNNITDKIQNPQYLRVKNISKKHSAMYATVEKVRTDFITMPKHPLSLLVVRVVMYNFFYTYYNTVRILTEDKQAPGKAISYEVPPADFAPTREAAMEITDKYLKELRAEKIMRDYLQLNLRCKNQSTNQYLVRKSVNRISERYFLSDSFIRAILNKKIRTNLNLN